MKNPLKIADLRHRLQTLGHPGGDTDFPRRSVVRFGVPALDRALPWGGLPPSCLHEIAGRDDEAAAHGFATALLTRFAEEQSILWCRLQRATRDMGVPYGPGLARFGLKPEHVLFAEATRPIDVLWTLEEGLRTKGVAVVYGEGIAADLTASRRLQLAAETGGKTAVLLTPSGKKPMLSAATTRWCVTALPSYVLHDDARLRWRTELVRCRGGNPGAWILEWDHAALRFDLATPLADGLLASTAG